MIKLMNLNIIHHKMNFYELNAINNSKSQFLILYIN